MGKGRGPLGHEPFQAKLERLERELASLKGARRHTPAIVRSANADDEQLIIDGVVITAFGKKAPAIKKSNDAGLDEQRTSERNALMKVVSLLQAHDDLVLSTLSHIQGAIARKANSHKRERTWADTYCRIKYLPKYYMAAWLQQLVGISTGVIDAIDAADPDNGIRFVFEFLLMVEGGDTVPKEMLDKVACSEILGLRLRFVGRHQNFVSRYVKQDGSIDWLQAGAYIVEWTEAKAVAVVHRSSGHREAIPSHLVVDDSWQLEDNVHDMKTSLRKGGTHHLLHKLFGADRGPHLKKKICKGRDLKNLAVRYKSGDERLGMNLDEAKLISEDKVAILRSAEKHRKEKMSRVATERKAESKRRKTIQLQA